VCWLAAKKEISDVCSALTRAKAKAIESQETKAIAGGNESNRIAARIIINGGQAVSVENESRSRRSKQMHNESLIVCVRIPDDSIL